MPKPSLLLLIAAAFALGPATVASALTPEELEQRFKQLPTVPEAEMPPLPNQSTSFRGLLEHDGLEGYTWVTFPFVENPGSFGFDPSGALYVAEANRFWLGVPDLRGANELIRDDFQAVTVEDRLALYEKFKDRFPEGWFSRVADRIIRLEDRDGNGAADHRTVFSDRFKEPLDGIGFSVLADDGSVYFTCIPHVWKLTDTDGDGIADEETAISSGYGVRVSFIGHDLHGIVRGPDGRLYFSVGDRGYHVTDANGVTHPGSGRGAIFRCESDGSGLEVFCEGLRNPQELAFDNYGNLFTFDNTGDIGDLARMVYALEGTDSGWDMAHQSAHHYATHLDWGGFRPEKSMWVEERMFDTWNDEQPQWVYPPASHVARGPSGVTWLTGESLPENLREKFLLANYRGPSENCTILLIGIEPSGAGYTANSEEILVKGIGASDVEQGYDGKIYFCDFGGGWSVNENGSIQVAQSKNAEEQAAGEAVATLFREGFADRSSGDLVSFLSHADRRVRQAAQFALVDKEQEGLDALLQVARTEGEIFPRLHAIWGLGQLGRRNVPVNRNLLELLSDPELEVRANAARVLGDLRCPDAKESLVETLASDDSIRVRSLAAIALGRITLRGDAGATEALFSAAVANEQTGTDVVLRHAILTALDHVATTEAASSRASSESVEERLLALLSLRRRGAPEIANFLHDADPLIAREAVRAIYDTDAVDSPAGDLLAQLGSETVSFPASVQRRVVAANYRRGSDQNARQLVALAGETGLAHPVRKAALIGLKEWETAVDTDPVHGTYRPIARDEKRTLAGLAEVIAEELRIFLTEPHDPELITLGVELATSTGIELDPQTLLAQVNNRDLPSSLRAAVLDSLAKSGAESAASVVSELWSDEAPVVRAAALNQGFALELDGVSEAAKKAVTEDELIVARAGLEGLASTDPGHVAALWQDRESKLRKGLWLDAYLLLSAAGNAEVAAYAAADPNNVYQLSLEGGDPAAGDIVFRNQGACLQCHKVENDGGVQGPALTNVGKRLDRSKILEAVVNPGAEITKGYGMTTVTLKDGNTVVGRLSNEAKDHIVVVGLDNQPTRVERDVIKEIAPPVSAMPPVAMALPPKDLRNLVSYLAGLKGRGKGNDSSHGEESHGDGEKVAK